MTDQPDTLKDRLFADGSSDDIDLLVAILKLASVINRPMKEGLADPEGLTLNEMRALMSLGGEGELAGHELSRAIGMQPMNASRALTALEKRGWIEEVEDADNRRRKPYAIADAGIDAYRAMIPEFADIAETLFSDLTDAERRRFRATTQKITDRIAQWQVK
ncbi:MarR family winged helix-turn-helix transcriptional regulator [Parasphingopyxis marina]|uniref:Winged helix-turn-helix transcriptional regulator n=1 Tax=Parasphingopyxis marina TaxID=2761622 RepID=A0A842HYU0_9SPHN|nr:MarR family winged helix-turn-helix transcriptional regulator [Parasphingopyxis marina]MBC2777090.1 winged helix-turn-helix transcriptional regulator [Parasphingopyxis marina]